MTIITHNEAETELAGANLGRALPRGSVVALYGGLGAGKTAFTRGLADALGVSVSVSSPTFTIVNEYPGRIALFHFDMYRLDSVDELYDIGWDDYLERDGICCVEWSEKVPGAFPPGTIHVNIEKVSDDTRRIEITSEGKINLC